MLMSSVSTFNPAVVARINQPSEVETYLLVTSAGRAIWIEDPEAATAFPSVRGPPASPPVFRPTRAPMACHASPRSPSAAPLDAGRR